MPKVKVVGIPRNVSTLAQRERIQEYKRKHPKSTRSQISQFMKKTEGLDITLSAIGKILKMDLSIKLPPGKNKENVKTTRKAKWPDLERALFVYHHIMESTTTVTRDMIRDALNILWDKMYPKEERPGFDGGWFRLFVDRHGIRFQTNHEEAGSVNMKVIEEKLNEIRSEVSKYDLKNIYNCGASALFWNQKDNKGYSTEACEDDKTYTERFTLHFCCNADGSDKVPLWIIGTGGNPYSSGPEKKNSTNLNCIYKHNADASMNAEIMTDWLKYFNSYVKNHNKLKMGEKVLLLMDNFSAHVTAVQEVGELSHTKVLFLPATSTLKTQPLDQGIIKSFKGLYRKRWSRFMVQKRIVENLDPIKCIDISTAITWSTQAWSDLATEFIFNCWKHANILPHSFTVNTPLEAIDEDSREEIRQSLAQLTEAHYLDENIDVDEFVDPDYEAINEGCGDELLNCIANQLKRSVAVGPSDHSSDNIDSDTFQMKIDAVVKVEDSPPIKPPTTDQALEIIEKLSRFEAAQEDSQPEFLGFLSKLEERIRKRQKTKARQMTISDFFSSIPREAAK